MADAVTDFFIPDYFYEPKPESLELTGKWLDDASLLSFCDKETEFLKF